MLLIRAALVASLALAAFAPLPAQSQVAGQQAPAKPPTAIIVGQLVDGDSGSPVPGAMITLSPAGAPSTPSGDALPPARGPQPPTPAVQPLRVLTDQNGRFVFYSLAAGSYSLGAAHPSYQPSSFGQTQATPALGRRPLQLADGERVTNATMKIWKFASISGTILDEAGEPAVGATVRLMAAESTVPRQYRMLYMDVTDDRGMYRLAQLTPGDYLVVVPAMVTTVPTETAVAYLDEMGDGPNGGFPVRTTILASGGTLTSGGTRIGDLLVQPSMGRGGLAVQVTVSDSGKTMVYPATYFGGGSTIASATVVKLRSGEERSNVNISMRPVPAVRVSGVVLGADGPVANITVKFAPAAAEALVTTPSAGPEIAQTITRANGTFTALGLPAGEYVATVMMGPDGRPTGGRTVPMLWGKAAVSARTDVDRVTIRLARGATVSGKLEFEPGSIPPPNAAGVRGVGIALTSDEGGPMSRSDTATIAPDGSFATQGSPSGRYTFTVRSAMPGWALKSAMSGGRDLLAQPLELTGDDVTGVVVTFTDKVAELAGTVTKGADDGDAFVVAVPIDARVSSQVNTRRAAIAAVGSDGAYRLTGLVAGEYFVVAAAPAGGRADLQDEQTLASLARRGTRVTLTEKEKRTMPLAVVRGR